MKLNQMYKMHFFKREMVLQEKLFVCQFNNKLMIFKGCKFLKIAKRMYVTKGEKKMKQYRIDKEKGLELGLYSLGDHISNPLTGDRISAEQRIHELIEASKLADEAGIDVFAVGE